MCGSVRGQRQSRVDGICALREGHAGNDASDYRHDQLTKLANKSKWHSSPPQYYRQIPECGAGFNKSDV
jgi:hypothetical protein